MMVAAVISLMKSHGTLILAAVAIVATAVAFKAEHELLLRARTQLAQVTAELRQAESIAKAQGIVAETVNTKAKEEHDLIQSQLESALTAARLTGNALDGRVLDYENHRSACPVPGQPVRTAGNPRSHGDATGPGRDRSIDESLAALPGACQAVVDQLRAAQAWAQSVKCTP